MFLGEYLMAKNKMTSSGDLGDWYQAYRKMKVDYFYNLDTGNFASLLEYERYLDRNLGTLQHIVMNWKEHEDFFKTKDFLGTFYLRGKSYEKDGKQDTKEKAATCNFRIVANPSIDYLVLSSYWLMKAGDVFDKKLPKYLYANRMRRTKEGELNKNALGNFEIYAHKYRSWRDNALNVVQKALENDETVSVITLDVKNYYYSINPEFLADPLITDQLEPHLHDIHALFSYVIKLWNEETRSVFQKSCGIPVGLPASGLLANIALQSFDQLVNETLHPLYYGRYVDDIIIVLGEVCGIESKEQFFQKLGISKEDDLYEYQSNTALDGKYRFGEEKCKYILFGGTSGKVRLEVFRKQLDERTSEWRELPNLPAANRIGVTLLAIFDGEAELSNHLRDSTNLAVVRSRFAFMLRDCEVYARTFSPGEWSDKLEAFLKTFAEYCLTEERLFTFERYIKRVLALGVLCGSYVGIAAIIKKLHEVIGSLQTFEGLGSNGIEITDTLFGWYRDFFKDSISAALNQTNPSFDRQTLISFLNEETAQAFRNDFCPPEYQADYEERLEEYGRYFLHDLAAFPVKTLILRIEDMPLIDYKFGRDLYKKYELKKSFPRMIIERYSQPLRGLKFKEFETLDCRKLSDTFYKYLYFLTRPLNEYDMYFDLNECTQNQELEDGSDEFNFDVFSWILKALRGYGAFNKDGKYFKSEKSHFKIPLDVHSRAIDIALACYSMEERTLDLLLRDQKDANLTTRYERFTHLVNRVLGSRNTINYLVFPELAIPIKWFSGAARKLQKRRINFISGVEYFIGDKTISNQVWACLNHSAFDYNSYVFLRQKKLTPAPAEFHRITKESQASLAWDPPEKYVDSIVDNPAIAWPPVVVHGQFFFSMLICVELMNIQYRNALRGKVDCLFVPEWNRDTNSFNDLVSASALDLHAFIVQCNNNKYGDCRIRGPFKENYRRDVVMAKGGENDYFVLGRIDIEELRDFQLSKYKEGPFKPLPVGYKMSAERKSLYLKKDG